MQSWSRSKRSSVTAILRVGERGYVTRIHKEPRYGAIRQLRDPFSVLDLGRGLAKR
jgi:hypothetical protein